MGMTDKRFTKLMDWAAKQFDEIDLESASLEIGETLDGKEKAPERRLAWETKRCLHLHSTTCCLNSLKERHQTY